ncbi:NUDIX domain-containing protein [Solihabitans fulvus]|uniref:NUDIX domain-containing protein n=1 Tax=Solihabitans fulvus TaxID=1892852 RepID=A0A5B2WYY7_9PSEU|nr:NUDIX domain-containing protein [Solihabitans fulvus]KAA2256120.1 NUDIX domain-containing protein [Solihabitans fulvus]
MATTLLVLLAVALLLGPWILRTASRLDRLHVRTDAAWAAVDATLARRAVVTRAVTATGRFDDATVARLRSAADRAEHAARPEREAAENELSRLLGELDRDRLPHALVAELADAEQRVMLARRVHNDAVRDTLALRRRRPVRWLKLAGTAGRPEYFEIAEPASNLAEPVVRTARAAARVLLLDGAGRVLLFEGIDPARPSETFWFTVGGGIEPGEALRAAAVREAFEETGLRLPAEDLVGPVWRRRVSFSFDGEAFDAEEWFFVANSAVHNGDEHVLDVSGFTELEERTVRRHRWWSAEELRSTEDTVYPMQLGELLPGLVRNSWDGQTRVVR